MRPTRFKRFLVGKPISSHEESRHRLSKKVALAVFSSDALSSSAYATDEILLVLMLAGTLALSNSIFIAVAVVTVLTVVILSYRQTVHAYPKGGGAYTVVYENLGPRAGLTAASALLIDYVLTVSVSVAAGVSAVGAALPEVRDNKVALALAVVAFVAALNLRGLKESGTIFAVPTYGFLLAMGLMIGVGVVRTALGDIQSDPQTHLEVAQPLSLFLILRAFASGSTALTGVEAISNGVPAFKEPEAANASKTLGILGILLGTLFLGITWLSRELSVDPELIEQGHTVTSQIARGVFGESSPMYLLVQAFTALILFLAANTAFADFPRLASILSKDRYLPRGLGQRGDRLAFSNGIVILTVAAGAILVNYGADVHRIVPLYVIGVFTSFTLSQGGMVIHELRAHRRIRAAGAAHGGWRRRVAISGFGAATTFLVLIIVSLTKFLTPVAAGEQGGFRGGAWQIIVLIPAVAYLLAKIRRHYDEVDAELAVGSQLPEVRGDRVVLVVTRFRGATKALAFARATSPRDLRAVSFGASELRLANLRSRWQAMGIKLTIQTVGNRVNDLLGYVRQMGPTPDEPVTVIFPDPQYRTWAGHLLRNRRLLRLKKAFLFENGTVLVSVPFHFDADDEPEPSRLQAPGRLALIVVISSLNKASLRAISYARSLNPSDIKAMTIQTEPGQAAQLTAQWSALKIDIPLEIVDSPFRDLVTPLIRELRRMNPSPTDAVGVVIPEFVVRRWWQGLLHTQSAFFIKGALLFEPNVVVIDVPSRLGRPVQDHHSDRVPTLSRPAGQ
ncbi:MAG: APC family permease [Actinomycetota bacterium]